MDSILAQLGSLLTKKMSNKAEHMRGLEEVLAGMAIPAVSKARSEWFNVHQVAPRPSPCAALPSFQGGLNSPRGWQTGELARGAAASLKRRGVSDWFVHLSIHHTSRRCCAFMRMTSSRSSCTRTPRASQWWSTTPPARLSTALTRCVRVCVCVCVCMCVCLIDLAVTQLSPSQPDLVSR